MIFVHLHALCFLRFFIQTWDEITRMVKERKTNPTPRNIYMFLLFPWFSGKNSNHNKISSVQLHCYYSIAKAHRFCQKYVYIPPLSQIELWVLFPGNRSAKPIKLHLLTRSSSCYSHLAFYGKLLLQLKSWGLTVFVPCRLPSPHQNMHYRGIRAHSDMCTLSTL